ncbi:MAG: hypothetical protein NTY22_07285, partial [Proteobacteria bacterium]|nr:hypothetical protein [Pseudomonadota bacterium]
MKIFGIKVFYTILELFRIVKCSRFSFSLKTKRKHDKVLIIMNGTSIMEALKKIDADIEKFDTICVNSFVTTDLFLKIRPRYYLMIDPTYWLDSVEPEVEITRESIYSDLISKVDWEMYLIVPAYPKKIAFAEKVALMNKNIKLLKINITSISLGFKTIREFIYKINLGMPHPQNILVAGIFFAINMHYKEACLIG